MVYNKYPRKILIIEKHLLLSTDEKSIPSFRQQLLEIEKQKRKKFKFYLSHLASSLDRILQFPLFLQSGHHFCCKTSSVSLPLGSATFLLPHSHLITGYSTS